MLRTRWSPSPGQVALAFVIVLAGAYLVRAATHTYYWQPDDELYRQTAGYVADQFPGSLFTIEPYLRGIQRLHIWLIAAPLGVSDGSTAFFWMHLLQVAAFVSAAIPAYLIARGLGATPAFAVLAGTLTIVLPWAVISVSLLTEPVGYGVFCWLVWAVWRAAAMPSARADVLALGLTALALLARTGFLTLVVLFPLVAVLQSGRYAGLRAFHRRHRVLAPVAGLGALVALLVIAGVIPVTKFTGFYATGFQPPFSQVVSKDHTFLSRVVLGTGFLPAILALPWWVRQLARPEGPAAYAWALTAVLAAALIVFANYNSPGDERYVMYLAPLVVVTGVVALGSRAVPWWGVVAGAAAVGLLAFTADWYLSNKGGGAYLGVPVEIFRDRVLREGLEARTGVSPKALLLAAALATTAAAAIAARGGRARRPIVAALAGLLLVFQLVATGYVMGKYVEGPGQGTGPGLAARSWVDDHVPRNASVVDLALTDAASREFVDTWSEVNFFNTTIDKVAVNEAGSAPYPRFSTGIKFKVDPASGRIVASSPLPEYGVAPTQPYTAVRVAGPTVATSTYQPLRLQRIARPAWAQWTVLDAAAGGAIVPGRPVHVQVYRPHAPARACAQVTLALPAAYPRRRGMGWYADDGRNLAGHGRLRPGESRKLNIRLRPDPHSARRFLPIGLVAEGSRKLIASVSLAGLDLVTCRRTARD